MNSKILNTIVNNIDNKDEIKKQVAKNLLEELRLSVQNCQDRFGGKSELATEDDLRIIQLCDKWEKILSHGIKTNLSNSAIQSLVTAGLNYTFNIINVGNSLWSYTCLHLTKHEKERFKILSNVNTPLGYFRAFLRSSMNERSLERYLQSWVSHGLLLEYYEDSAVVRDVESSKLLPKMAADLSSILFALSIDRVELNDTQQNHHTNRAELVIPLPTPVKSTGNLKKKPVRQIISFDKNEIKTQTKNYKKNVEPEEVTDLSKWKSAPATCLNSPDPKNVGQLTSNSEPTTSSDNKSSLRYFFPDSVKGLDSPSQILSKLSERTREIFSSSNSINTNNVKDDASINNLKIFESDSDELAGSIDGSASCLELCFTEDESVHDDKFESALDIKENDYLSLQIKYKQLELTTKEKIQKLEKVVLDLSKENDRLKEQLRQYMSAVELGIALKNGQNENDEVSLYEKKLTQVVEMHTELMEFNLYLQRRIQLLESAPGIEMLECPQSNVKVFIPQAFLVGKKTHSYHVYQIFLKIGIEEWSIFHRYAKFYELHTQLKKCHPDLANYNFPPKKTLGKKSTAVVEQRRAALQSYLRHVVLVLPELRDCTSRASLVTLLPFFGDSSTSRDNGVSTLSTSQRSVDSTSAIL